MDAERAAERIRLSGLVNNPTIIADMEDGWPDPETEVEDLPPSKEAPAAETPPAGAASDEEEATAEDFVGAVPDATMILRRPRHARSAESSDDVQPDEVALARAERDARRKAQAGQPPLDVAERPAIQAVRPAPSVVAAHAADRWAECLRSLEREASARQGSTEQAVLYAAAGRVAFERLGDWDQAERLFGLALGAGILDPEVLKLQADVMASKGEFEALRDLLVTRAGACSGPLAAEALQDAALVERNSLRRPEQAAELLELALIQDPTDWFALRLLREIHHRSQDWAALAGVLERMAAMLSGPRSARIRVELGRLFEERIGDSDAALRAFSSALAAEPGYTPAFLAVERLSIAAGDLVRLTELYRTKAALSDGADRDFWLGRALRTGRSAGADLLSLIEGASQLLPSSLRAELQASFAQAGDWSSLARSLAEEAETLSGAERAWVLLELGRVQEAELALPDEALASYLSALEADPAADPARDSAEALLARSGQHRELVSMLEASLGRVDDPNKVVATLYRVGEICEGPLKDLAGARQAWERVLQAAPGYLPAMEGLERVYSAQQDWEALISVYEQRAILTEEPSAVANQLYRSGGVCEHRLGDLDRARDYYRRALETSGDFQPALDSLIRLLEAQGDLPALAQVLATASESTRDSSEMVSLAYRAARVRVEAGGDPAVSLELLRRCLEISPGFLPAIQLQRSLASSAGEWSEVLSLDRLEADATVDVERRSWRLLSAARAANLAQGAASATAVLEEILDAQAEFAPALRALGQLAMAAGDAHAKVAVYQRVAFGTTDDAGRAEVSARIADLAVEAGDVVTAMNAVSEVIAAEGADRPLLALATLAEGANYWEEAQRALIARGDTKARVELARIQETWIEDPAAAARTWGELLAEDPTNVQAAAGLERCLSRAGRRDGLAQAHGVLADNVPDRPVAAVHALLAGHLNEAEGELDQGLHYYRLAFESRPVRGKAFDAMRRVLAQRKDVEGLRALFASLSSPAVADLASTFEECQAESEAVACYRELLADESVSPAQRLAWLARSEQSLAEVGDWKGLFETTGQRLELTTSPEERASIEARRRWILAEHLAESDEAWDLYRQLHEANPEDAEVLEALARIAGARGETRLAIQYLSGLAAGTTEPTSSARYQRRIAEAWLAVDDPTQAREALLRALDFEPRDLPSLHLLKELATRAEDWSGVVGALAREATVLEGEEQTACYREIARTWQDRIGNAAVARDGWRKVLEVAPEDSEALSRLLDLARAESAWGQVVEYGAQRVRQLHGEEQSALLFELGRVQLEKLHREDEAIRLLDAASRAEVPSLPAAQMLERLHSSRGQWDRVADTVIRQARVATGADRVALLLRAAEVRAETLHDRAGAAEAYAEVLADDPSNRKALRFRGDFLFEEGDLAGAVEAWMAMGDWEDELDLDDFDDRMDAALFSYRLGEALARQGRTEEAGERFRRALKFNGSHLPSLESLGPILMAREQWEEAAEIYRQILQLIGGQAEPERLCRTYANLGSIELRQGALDKAKKRFVRALELKSNDIPSLQGMAGVLFARKDWNNLLNVYNNVIYHAQEPADVVNAYLTKGFILDAKLSLPDKAAQHYEKSLAFNPAQPNSLLRLAELALRRQDWAEAGSLADRGLVLDDVEPGLRAGLLLAKAVAHGSVGDSGASGKALEEALAVDVSLVASLRADSSVEQVHQVLTQRLHADL